MAYLFWAFATVWIGLFAYLYGLVRRSRALERQVAELRDRIPADPSPASGSPAGDAGRPSREDAADRLAGGAARTSRGGASGGIVSGQ